MILTYEDCKSNNIIEECKVSVNSFLFFLKSWNDEFIQKSSQGKRFSSTVQAINECQKFMQGCGISVDKLPQLQEADFFISHEGLLLPYEDILLYVDMLLSLSMNKATEF